jgi:hypothetical protein
MKRCADRWWWSTASPAYQKICVITTIRTESVLFSSGQRTYTLRLCLLAWCHLPIWGGSKLLFS